METDFTLTIIVVYSIIHYNKNYNNVFIIILSWHIIVLPYWVAHSVMCLVALSLGVSYTPINFVLINILAINEKTNAPLQLSSIVMTFNMDPPSMRRGQDK